MIYLGIWIICAGLIIALVPLYWALEDRRYKIQEPYWNRIGGCMFVGLMMIAGGVILAW